MTASGRDPGTAGKGAHPVRDWTTRQGWRLLKGKARREAAALEDAPRFRLRWPWDGSGGPRGGDQVLRAFIQINLLPRPR